MHQTDPDKIDTSMLEKFDWLAARGVRPPSLLPHMEKVDFCYLVSVHVIFGLNSFIKLNHLMSGSHY